MSLPVPSTLITVEWLVFWIYWLMRAMGNKPSMRGGARNFLIRFVILAIVIVVWHSRLGGLRSLGGVTSGWRPWVGALLVTLGLSFAVWARIHLGRNWGMPMTRRKEPELVTDGPYRLVRHPIYTGVLAAMLGTCLVAGWWFVIAPLFFGAYFVYSTGVEERDMERAFGERYREYKARSKCLIPWVW